MKRYLVGASIAVALTGAIPSFAGPGVGNSHFRGGSFGLRRQHTKKVQPAPYALTGTGHVMETVEYRWVPKLKWVGGHRDRRVVHERVPIE